MKLNGSTTFWIGLIVSGLAGLLFIVMAHSSEPLPHSEAASEQDLGALEVRVATIDNEVKNVGLAVVEIKETVASWALEQRLATREILEAIRTSE